MPKNDSISGLTFTEACEHLSLLPEEFVGLRDEGFILCVNQNGKQVYPQTALDATQRLLTISRERDWPRQTLAWYGDLVFATQVGRAITLDLRNDETSTVTHQTNWLASRYVGDVLNDLIEGQSGEEGLVVTLIRSLVAVGEGHLFPDVVQLEQTALYPIVTYYEQRGIKIIDQQQAVARDAGFLIYGLVFVFELVASPMSRELNDLLKHIRGRFAPQIETSVSIPEADRAKIRKESKLIAVDKLYAANRREIHSPPKIWDVKLGVLIGKNKNVTKQLKVPIDASEPIIDNIIDFIRPFLGEFGARVVLLLYQIANDAPYWRTPRINVQANDLLDKLGMTRRPGGWHDSANRAELRDVLNTAHEMEIGIEFSTYENGEEVTKAIYNPVLSIIGGTYDPKEREGIATGELRKKGLPKSLTIHLNYYDGVRRPDGKLGSQYVLVPRLAEPNKLPKANHVGAAEPLKAYLLFRYRQTRMVSRTLTVTRATALEKAGITNKNASRATMTLRKALDKLVQEGILEGYSQTLPTQPNGSFDVVLSEAVVYIP